MEHTKEPWACNHQGWCTNTEKLENQRRIVACVNACAGITTEALELHSGPTHESIIEVGEIIQQRDGLLVALDIARKALAEVAEQSTIKLEVDWARKVLADIEDAAGKGAK